MSNLILLISDNSTVDRQLRVALTSSAPGCRLKLATKRADLSVPAAIGITAVLDKRMRFSVGAGHLLQLSE